MDIRRYATLGSGLFLLTTILLTGCVTPTRDVMQAGEYVRYDRLSLPEEWRGTASTSASFTAGRADLDREGEFGSTEVSGDIRGFGPMPWLGGFAVARLDASLTDYDWDGTTRFFRGDDAEEPIEDSRSVRGTWVQIQALSEEYGVAAVFSHGYSAERDGDLEDGRTTLYGLGAFYFFEDGVLLGEDRLLLAGGVAAADRFDVTDRDTTIIPGIQMVWTIDDDTEVFLLGTQLAVVRTIADYWRASLLVDYDSTTFRTDKSLKPNGDKAVATDSYIPVMFQVNHQFSERFDLTVGVGARFGRMITIDYGPRDEKERVDTQLAFRLNAILYF